MNFKHILNYYAMKTLRNSSALCNSLFNRFIKVKKRRPFLLISILWLTIFNCQAQAPLDGVFNYVNGAPVFYVEVPDSNAVSQIELTLGSDATQTDIFNHIFDFDVATGLPSGFRFHAMATKCIWDWELSLIHQSTMPKCDSKTVPAAWSDYYEFYGN
jgi:hypothetical protein